MAIFQNSLWLIISILSIAFDSSRALPKPTPGGAGFLAASGSISNPPIAFDGANVGVNFGGYHASAGLGGLLSGGSAKGGLHAEAGTAYGQQAEAGLGGAVAGGMAAGGLYAGADSGAGAAAEAGLGGVVAGESAGGFSAAGSSASSAASSGSISASKSVSGSFSSSYSASSGGGVVAEEKVRAPPKKTYIERTVIPNYVEKTVEVPSYVEKTIRVPTVVTKKVKVETAPTIIEKTVEAPQHKEVEGGFVGGVGASASAAASASASASAGVSGVASMSAGSGTVSVVEQENPVVHTHRYYSKPFFGGFFAGGGGYGGGGAASAGGSYTIPIQTLGAVSRLVGGIAGGTSASGSFAFNKQYGYKK